MRQTQWRRTLTIMGLCVAMVTPAWALRVHAPEATEVGEGALRNRSRHAAVHGDALAASGQPEAALLIYLDGLEATRALLERGERYRAYGEESLYIYYGRVARVHGGQGRAAEAIEAFGEALRYGRERMGGTSGSYSTNIQSAVKSWPYEISLMLMQRGDLQSAQGEVAEALRSYDEGLSVARRAVRQEAGNLGYQYLVLCHLARVGKVHLDARALDEAHEALVEANNLARWIAARDDETAERVRGVAQSYNLLALWAQAAERPAETLRAFEGALIAYTRYAAIEPDAGSAEDLLRVKAELSTLYDRLPPAEILASSRRLESQLTELEGRLGGLAPILMSWVQRVAAERSP